ncbi:MAG: glycosyltransferase family 4 protein [Syntrophorhabdaceae bacterium]|nr:glycosyltransferase family 4 protein [Syntrophorhabdaceae bacterium]
MSVRVTVVCSARFHHFDLARQLSKRDMLVKFFAGYPGWKLRGEDLPSEKVVTFPWFTTPYMALSRWGMLKEPLQRELAWAAHEALDTYVSRRLPECDVLFVLSGSGLRSFRVASRLGIRTVCDRGSSHIRYQEAILKEEFSQWGERFPGIDPRFIAKEEAEYEAADIITVPSEFARNSFVEMGVSPLKLRKAPYGVDLRCFEKTCDPEKGGFDVLFVGQVSFQKGVPYLLKAFEGLRHSRKCLRIVGPMQPEMERYLKRYPPAGKVEILGAMPQKELKNVMSRSHVMVLPSVEEGLALVQAQAMACGCPVIGTTNTGASDLFTDGVEGFIVRPRDPCAITERLQLMADDPEQRNRISENALKRVAGMGGWDDYGARISEILAGMTESHVDL